MKQINDKRIWVYSLGIMLTTLLGVTNATAEDWTISAADSCETTLGNTVSSGVGLKASGGTAAISCPLVKEVASAAIIKVWARIVNASSTDSQPLCNLISSNNFSGPAKVTFNSPITKTGNVSTSMEPGNNQYIHGYAKVICILNSDDILYGVRYQQKN